MIDIKKAYETQDGREVRFYSDGGSGRYPIHAAVKETIGWVIESFTADGHYHSDNDPSPYDLIEIKPAAIDQVIAWLSTRVDNGYRDGMRVKVFQEALTEARRIKAEAEKEPRDE